MLNFCSFKGNLCRCTGYRPIMEAFSTFSTKPIEKGKIHVDEDEAVESYDASTFKEYIGEPFNPKNLNEMKTFSNEKLLFKNSNDETSWFKPHTLADAFNLLEKYPTSYLRQGGTGRYKKFENIDSRLILDISGIYELKSLQSETNGIKIGSGVTLTNLRNYLNTLVASEPNTRTRVLRELSSIIDNVATEQVRNVASLGGNILWAHPASDIVPLLIVSGATLQIGKAEGIREIAVGEFYKGNDHAKLQQGEILLTISIPFTSEHEKVKFYKHARRKTADLAIANMAVGYEEAEPGHLRNVKMVIGGIGIAVKKSKQFPITLATNTSSLLTSTKISSISKLDICKSVKEDMRNANISLSKIDLMAFRISLCVGFLEQFREYILQEAKYEQESTSSLKCHQLFEKVPDDQVEIDPITRPLPHLSSAEHCSGESVFIDDIPKYINELQLFPVQSKVAHGKIKKICTDKAFSIPGVFGWISAKDVPGKNFWSIAEIENGVSDEELFPFETVQYFGQIVGVIAADNVAAGESAVKAVDIEYEENEPILNVSNAFNKDSYHGKKRNLKRIQDVVSERKDFRTIESKVCLGGQEHFYFEPHSAVAVPSGEKQEMIVHFTSQEPHNAQVLLSSVLNIPQHKIIVKCKRAGGGFGGKERCFVALMTAVAAHVMRRPCRMILTRDVDVDTTGHRHETKASYNIQYGQDGKIHSSKFEFDVNAGCSADLSLVWVDTLMRRVDGGYTLRNFEGKGVAWKTNLMSNTAYRGFGSPEGAIIIEDAIENIANVLCMDPARVREINLTREGDLLHHGTVPVNEDFLIKCWKECLDRSEYWKVKNDIDKFNQCNQQKKRGIAIVPMKFCPTIACKMLNQAGAYIRVYLDGSILLSHGGVEMGQGLHTKMVQVASRVLRVEMSRIHIMDTSSETVPQATPTAASCGTDLNGHAVINACKKLLKGIEPYRKEFPSDTWEQTIAKAYENRTPLAAFGIYNTSPLDYNFETNEGSMFNYLTFGVGCSVVEIDCLTGDHEVLRTDIVMDVGKSLNPAIDIGQIEGAFVQGYGYMTMEEMIHSDQGEVMNKNLSTYKIPTIADIPNEFNVTLLRKAGTKEESVFSSKGIGEPPLTLAVSVVCAIRQAIMSYRADHGKKPWVQIDIPVTSERIRMACEDEIVKFVTDDSEMQSNDAPILSILK